MTKDTSIKHSERHGSKTENEWSQFFFGNNLHNYDGFRDIRSKKDTMNSTEYIRRFYRCSQKGCPRKNIVKHASQEAIDLWDEHRNGRKICGCCD